jgi:competence ComEA-like helix-hairpin-helix protein
MQFRGILPSAVFLLALFALVLFLLGGELGSYKRSAQPRDPQDWVALSDPEYGASYYCIESGQLLGRLVEDVHPQLSDRLPDKCKRMALEAGTEVRFYSEPGSEERSCVVFPLSERCRYLLGMPLNVNRAGEEELDLLPGIGPKLAGRILEVRESMGRFSSPDELLQVPGIGERILQKMQGRICL